MNEHNAYLTEERVSGLMPTKKYLSQVYELERGITHKLQHITWLRGSATQTTSRTHALRISGTENRSPMESAVIRIIDLEREVDRDVDRQVDLKREIKELIDSIPQVNCRILLELRYLNLKTWDEIAQIMKYSFRNIHYLHIKALKALREVRSNPMQGKQLAVWA